MKAETAEEAGDEVFHVVLLFGGKVTHLIPPPGNGATGDLYCLKVFDCPF